MRPHWVEIPQTLADIPFLGAERFGERPAQRFKRDGVWQYLTYAELRDLAREVGLGLVALGIRPGDRVCVLSETRPEWVQVELGIAPARAVVVPIYPSSSPQECADRDRSELERRTAGVRPDDPALIIYTSGTTGRPKGCVLTHRNMTACCRITEELEIVGADDVAYLFLPLAHVFAQVVQLSVSSVGGVVAYCSGGASTIVPDCAEVRPTYVPSVPRVFEKVHALFASQVPADTLSKMVEVGLAVRRLERAKEPVPEQLRGGFEQADATLFARVRAVFGGRMRIAISGAAPIAPEILEFFHAAGVPVYEGYGLSESAAVGTLNTAEAIKIGSNGPAVPGCEIRGAEDGELLIRGPHVFAGYWANPEATAAALVDGWLQTGDLGSIDEDGFVTITGRKKDIIITAGGKNITPANLENDLRQSPWISQVVVYGDRRPYLVALSTLYAGQITPWAVAQGLPANLATLAAHPSVQALVVFDAL